MVGSLSRQLQVPAESVTGPAALYDIPIPEVTRGEGGAFAGVTMGNNRRSE